MITTLHDRVLHDISTVSGVPEERIQDTSGLRSDLLMTTVMQEALAPGFEKTARTFKHDALVLQSECAQLDTVNEAVALVAKKAGGIDPNTPVP